MLHKKSNFNPLLAVSALGATNTGVLALPHVFGARWLQWWRFRKPAGRENATTADGEGVENV